MTSSFGQPVIYPVREKQVLSHPNCLCVIQMNVANAIFPLQNLFYKNLIDILIPQPYNKTPNKRKNFFNTIYS